ncbi:Z-ring formation inhibitor MciZ [Paenibacillus chartarius]|uniref:Z-ring formation inhibitor MciZ n=1 Tax=Paenibacillus chartarius TaxID=747481 RepID=A0ABV6DNP3_9BACL
MKSYVAERQFRLAGKAWEVREYLRQQARAASSGDVLLADWLSVRTSAVKMKDRSAGKTHLQIVVSAL